MLYRCIRILYNCLFLCMKHCIIPLSFLAKPDMNCSVHPIFMVRKVGFPLCIIKLLYEHFTCATHFDIEILLVQWAVSNLYHRFHRCNFVYPIKSSNMKNCSSNTIYMKHHLVIFCKILYPWFYHTCIIADRTHHFIKRCIFAVCHKRHKIQTNNLWIVNRNSINWLVCSSLCTLAFQIQLHLWRIAHNICPIIQYSIIRNLHIYFSRNSGFLVYLRFSFRFVFCLCFAVFSLSALHLSFSLMFCLRFTVFCFGALCFVFGLYFAVYFFLCIVFDKCICLSLRFDFFLLCFQLVCCFGFCTWGRLAFIFLLFIIVYYTAKTGRTRILPDNHFCLYKLYIGCDCNRHDSSKYSSHPFFKSFVHTKYLLYALFKSR